MTRAGLNPGDIGEVSYSVQPNGQILARVRYRRHDAQEGRVGRVGGTKAKARRLFMAAARERMNDVTDSTSALTPDSTVAEVALAYLEVQADRNVGRKPQYLNDERELIRNYIVDTEFGNLTLRRVTTGAVTSEHRRIKKTLNLRGRASHWLTLTRKLLDLAAELDLVRSNAARAYKPARDVNEMGFTPDPAEVWELHKLVKAYGDRPDRRGPKPTPLLLDVMDVIAGTGLRIGEALGLRWLDIDFDGRIDVPRLNVVGTVVEGHGLKKHWQSTPKTKDGVRSVTMPPYLIKTLRRRQAEAELGDHTYVFETRTGEPVGPHQIRVQLWKVRDWVQTRPDLPQVSSKMAMHALRRMVATGVTDKHDVVIAARVSGHTESGVTEQKYNKRNKLAPDVSATTQLLGRPFGDEDDE
jgi:integrase